MTERLNCPFCGSDDISDGEILIQYPDRMAKQSQCMSCKATGPEVTVDGPDYGDVAAIAGWNLRARELDATAAPVVVGEDMVERAARAYVISASRINGQGYIDHEAMRAALTAALAGD